MEPSVKDRYIILGFVGFAILLISSIATLIVTEKFNQDNFVRLIVFVCGNLLGWLLYFSFQTVIFDTYEIYKIKFGKKKTLAETIKGREELPQSTLEPTAALKPMPTNGEAPAGTEPPIKLSIAPELHEKNRADYEDREQQEKEERIRMVMEYIHFYMPRIADEETVNHICKEVNSWMNLHTYKPKPITRRLTKEIINIPLRHFVWNISERFVHRMSRPLAVRSHNTERFIHFDNRIVSICKRTSKTDMQIFCNLLVVSQRQIHTDIIHLTIVCPRRFTESGCRRNVVTLHKDVPTLLFKPVHLQIQGIP